MGQIFGPSHNILTLINMIFQEGLWLWLSNAPFEYTDWGKNQPDNSDPRGENCLGTICILRKQIFRIFGPPPS